MATMIAARLHAYGQPMTLDRIDVPEPRPTDVLVEVKAGGVVAKVGEQVLNIRPGDRVYVYPARSCGSCRMCRSGAPLDCPSFTLQGYFGRSQDIMRAYPYGGLAQFIT